MNTSNQITTLEHEQRFHVLLLEHSLISALPLTTITRHFRPPKISLLSNNES